MKRIVVAGLLLLPAMGCSNMQGKWVADGPAPTGSPCVMNTMEFMDKSFTADATVEGRPMVLEGSYEYEPMMGDLKLIMKDGKERHYTARVDMMKKLTMSTEAQGKKFTQTFKQAK